MTTRTLFIIILKILGILFLKSIIATIPQMLSGFYYLTAEDAVNYAIGTFALTLLTIFIYGFISYYLIFKSDVVIDKLKLDKGLSEETISLNIHRSTILSISIIVIGGLIVADEIPNLCRLLFAYYQERTTTHGMTDPKISYAVLSAAKLIIGLLLLGNQRQIVNYIEYKRKR